MICNWAKKTKGHFFDITDNGFHVLAAEVGYEPHEMIAIRSWVCKVFKNKNENVGPTRPPKVEYRKVLECMKEVEGEVSANIWYNRLIKVIKHVHDILRTRQFYIKNWIQGHVEHNDYMTAVLKEDSFMQKWINITQHYHIAWCLVSLIFIPMLHHTKRHPNYIIGLIRSIFGNCPRRRDMVTCFFQIIMLFPTRRDWLSKSHVLQELLKQPCNIKNVVDSAVSRHDPDTFCADINQRFNDFALQKFKAG